MNEVSAKILKLIERAGRRGLTILDLERILELPHETCSGGAFQTLRDKGLIAYSGVCFNQPRSPGGRRAMRMLWCLAEYTAPEYLAANPRPPLEPGYELVDEAKTSSGVRKKRATPLPRTQGSDPTLFDNE